MFLFTFIYKANPKPESLVDQESLAVPVLVMGLCPEQEGGTQSRTQTENETDISFVEDHLAFMYSGMVFDLRVEMVAGVWCRVVELSDCGSRSMSLSLTSDVC